MERVAKMKWLNRLCLTQALKRASGSRLIWERVSKIAKRLSSIKFRKVGLASHKWTSFHLRKSSALKTWMITRTLRSKMGHFQCSRKTEEHIQETKLRGNDSITARQCKIWTKVKGLPTASWIQSSCSIKIWSIRKTKMTSISFPFWKKPRSKSKTGSLWPRRNWRWCPTSHPWIGKHMPSASKTCMRTKEATMSFIMMHSYLFCHRSKEKSKRTKRSCSRNSSGKSKKRLKKMLCCILCKLWERVHSLRASQRCLHQRESRLKTDWIATQWIVS